MKAIVPEPIEAYAAAHTDALHPVYAALREVTYARTSAPQMQVGHLEGRFLKLMAQLTSARRIVEFGTFTGYSSLCMAEGMADDGVLYTLDVDPETTAIAKAHWAKVPWGRKIESRLGPGIASVAAIDGPLDLVFIDADKESYVAYWDAVVPKMRPGGVIVADNVLWSGNVLDPQSASDKAIVAFNKHAAADPRVEKVMLTVRDGLLVARAR